MEWVKKNIKGVAEGKTSEEIQKEIQIELPKHFKPASVFNEINEKLKATNVEIETLKASQTSIQNEYENFKKGSISQADYDAKVKEIQENAKAEISKTKLDNAVDMYLINAKARNVKSVKANLNLEDVKQDGEELLGLKEQVDKLMETDAYLFNIEAKKNEGAEGHQGNQRKNEGEVNYSNDELDDLSDDEFYALQNKK